MTGLIMGKRRFRFFLFSFLLTMVLHTVFDYRQLSEKQGGLIQ